MQVLHVQCAPVISWPELLVWTAAGCGLALVVLVLVGLIGWWAAPRVRSVLSDSREV